MLIGNKIKDLRQQKKMTLVELSKKSGVQIATLSRMENLRMIGTIESHMNIAKALGVEFTELYQDNKAASDTNKATPAPAASETFAYNKNASYEMLTSNILTKKMMPILLRIEPHAQTNSEQGPAGAERFIFLLEGELTAHVGKEAYSLTPGKTLYFDASEKHFFENKGSAIARAISVMTPVIL